MVQEAWLRLSRQDAPAIGNLAGRLTTVVGRISLDVLRTRQARPEASYGDRLPELLVTADDGPAPASGRGPWGGSSARWWRPFLAAARRGDFEGLLRVRDPEVRLVVDTPDGEVAFTVAEGRITGITIVTDPAVLASLDLPDPA